MQKMIAVDPEVYKKIKALADANGRTIKRQMEWLVKEVELLPAPKDAHPVPIVYVKQEE